MNEEFLHFIFRYKLWNKDSCFLQDGTPFEIIDTGIYNRDSGPDFFNAKVKINNTVWVGNIEIHISASDWYKHSHHNDDAYNNVILHIVYNNNMPVVVNGRELPTWEIEFSHLLFNTYAEIKMEEQEISCSKYLDLVENFKSKIWMDRMAVERLEEKLNAFEDILNISSGNFENILYLSLARSFGFGTNADAFYSLALSVPLNVVRHYLNNVFSLEAIYFGQSGFLEEAPVDDYVIKLKYEYDYLRKKHQLFPMNHAMWKKSRMRPSGNPCLRIAQFAAVMTEFNGLLENITNNLDDYKSLRNFFNKQASKYWNNHYFLGKPTTKVNFKIGSDAFQKIYINTIIPMAFLWNKHYNINFDPELILDKLKNIKAEDNRIIRLWKKFNVIPQNAYESQALINLTKNYCQNKKCLNCNIAYEIINKIYSIN